MRRIDPHIVTGAHDIVEEVRGGGDETLLGLREQHDGIAKTAPLLIEREALESACAELEGETRSLLQRVARRIESFALAQRRCLQDLDVPIVGGRAGHQFAAVDRAGCYAPGGRYPLVSSVLMTAITAKVAGVADVCVATPSSLPIMQGAAAIAGATTMLHCGGAHAIAALAHGTETLVNVDVIAGPGNQWVTAAKQHVSGHVGIDMLAGPSELVVVADASSDARVVAADLLAQAEHDPDARVVLLTTSEQLVAEVASAAATQLAALPTREVAQASWSRATLRHCSGEEEIVARCNELAPEHLHLNLPSHDAHRLGKLMRHYGALFLGNESAEVLGDYGAGPNHVLPTDGSARHRGGLSVLTFLRMRTWLQMAGDAEVTADARSLANIEGLAAHDLSAAWRRR